MTDWRPDLTSSNAPRYIAIADSIEADLSTGRLAPGDRLPAQRHLAKTLGLDFTTVARGYTEARRRGLLSSQVGSGTYVADPENPFAGGTEDLGPRRSSLPDFSMANGNFVEADRNGTINRLDPRALAESACRCRAGP